MHEENSNEDISEAGDGRNGGGTTGRSHRSGLLTLARLARRLHLPEKRLSMAVNRATGDNVSRFISSWRTRHACALIATGANATEAMLASGFNTKSNFNREFLCETGVASSKWQASAQPASRGTTIGEEPDALGAEEARRAASACSGIS